MLSTVNSGDRISELLDNFSKTALCNIKKKSFCSVRKNSFGKTKFLLVGLRVCRVELN